MKVYMEDDYLIVYDFKDKIEYDKDNLESHFQKLFLKLNKIYGIEFEGYYHIDVYIDPFYGHVLKIKKEDFDYFFDHTIEMQINMNNVNGFLYECDLKPNFKCIQYEKDGILYLELKEKIDSISFGKLMECAKIIYDEEADRIKKSSIIVR